MIISLSARTGHATHALTALALAALALTAAGWTATEHAAAAETHARALDEADIRAQVHRYFDGMMEGSAAKLAAAFDENALLIGTARDGAALQRIPFAQWSRSWDGRVLENAAAYRNRIVDLHITGDAAMVRTVLDWPRVKYVDYLSLLKVGGEWKIVNKIWTEERR